MNQQWVIRIGTAVTAAALVGASAVLPLWSMRLQAPQYPKGLRLEAYGTRMDGDLREIAILNHYVGMLPVEMPAFEASLFPIGIGLLVALCLMAPLHRYLRRLAIAATGMTPVVILADLQWWLYTFGHTLDPHAAIRLKPYTPLVLGTTTVWNFKTTAMISSGIVCIAAAALVLALGARFARRFPRPSAQPISSSPIANAAALTLIAALPAVSSAQPLQQRLDTATPGSVVTVNGGTHHGRVTIRGPLTVIGVGNPTIDGGGTGSVVTIEGSGVVFRGFTVRNSGREVTEEAAGIKVTGDRHRIEQNTIRDVYFGIHVGGGRQHVIENNRIAPGQQHGARPGHGISVWHTRSSQMLRNRISDARDGIYLSFTEGILAEGNEITGCRYGMHSMYSENATFAGNRITGNLLGAALMMSDRLVLRGNRIEQHREGSAAYGVLLKDIGDLVAEDNAILANRIGVYAEGVPTRPEREAIVRMNHIAGNEVGLALQSNAALTLTGNRLADNLTDVRPLGRQLSAGMRWSRDGRGNAWTQYRGYDANRDGIGDVPHRVEDAMDALVRRNSLIQALLYTPAHLAVEAAARMFPVFRQQPVLVDEHPLMASAGRGWR